MFMYRWLSTGRCLNNSWYYKYNWRYIFTTKLQDFACSDIKELLITAQHSHNDMKGLFLYNVQVHCSHNDTKGLFLYIVQRHCSHNDMKGLFLYKVQVQCSHNDINWRISCCTMFVHVQIIVSRPLLQRTAAMVEGTYHSQFTGLTCIVETSKDSFLCSVYARTGDFQQVVASGIAHQNTQEVKNERFFNMD